MGTLLVVIAIIGFFTVLKNSVNNHSSAVLKRKYLTSLRKGDKIDALKWGRRYYGSLRVSGRATQADLIQIQRDIKAVTKKAPFYS